MSKDGFLIRGLFYNDAKCIFEVQPANEDDYKKIRDDPGTTFFALTNIESTSLLQAINRLKHGHHLFCQKPRKADISYTKGREPLSRPKTHHDLKTMHAVPPKRRPPCAQSALFKALHKTMTRRNAAGQGPDRPGRSHKTPPGKKSLDNG